jgi:hypothetical protein
VITKHSVNPIEFVMKILRNISDKKTDAPYSINRRKRRKMTTKFIYQIIKNAIPSLIFTLFIITAAVWTVSAQTAGTGALSGTITDQNEATVAGAQVKVKNEKSGEERSVNSGENGTYVVPLLPPGTYRSYRQ